MSIFTDISQYMPHGMCLLWQPWLLILWAGSDLLIVAAYFAIPVALLRVLAKRDDIKHRGLVVLFASFILLCGITHALSVVTLWVPIYPLVGMVKLATGIVSAITAFTLFLLIPKLIAIPSLNSLEISNRKLTMEIEAHEATLADLRQTRSDLEKTVERRTAELKQANSQLAVTAREAVHRSRNLISVVSAMARQSARGAENAGEFADTLIGRLNALSDATSAIIKGDSKSSASLEDVVTRQLAPVMQTYPGRIDVTGPEVAVGAEAAQQLSLAIHELATNAQKYGSLKSDDARVALSWHVQDADTSEARLILTWDEGVILTDAGDNPNSKTTGFGYRLLTQIIPMMLNGEAERALTGSHLRYTLTVPMAAIGPDMQQSHDERFADDILNRDFAQI